MASSYRSPRLVTGSFKNQTVDPPTPSAPALKFSEPTNSQYVGQVI